MPLALLFELSRPCKEDWKAEDPACWSSDVWPQTPECYWKMGISQIDWRYHMMQDWQRNSFVSYATWQS